MYLFLTFFTCILCLRIFSFFYTFTHFIMVQRETLKLYKNLLGSLTDVITNLKPFASVPQLSVTYLSVTKLVRVNIELTVCFV